MRTRTAATRFPCQSWIGGEMRLRLCRRILCIGTEWNDNDRRNPFSIAKYTSGRFVQASTIVCYELRNAICRKLNNRVNELMKCSTKAEHVFAQCTVIIGSGWCANANTYIFMAMWRGEWMCVCVSFVVCRLCDMQMPRAAIHSDVVVVVIVVHI